MEMLKNKLIELVTLFDGQRDKNGQITENYETNRLARLAIESELKDTFGLNESNIKKMQKYLIYQGQLIASENYRRNVLNMK